MRGTNIENFLYKKNYRTPNTRVPNTYERIEEVCGLTSFASLSHVAHGAVDLSAPPTSYFERALGNIPTTKT